MDDDQRNSKLCCIEASINYDEIIYLVKRDTNCLICCNPLESDAILGEYFGGEGLYY